jgi:hypothetical protein
MFTRARIRSKPGSSGGFRPIILKSPRPNFLETQGAKGEPVVPTRQVRERCVCEHPVRQRAQAERCQWGFERHRDTREPTE